MRKSRQNLYNWIFGGVLFIHVILIITVFKVDSAALRKFYVDYPLFALYQVLFIGVIISMIMMRMYENGRKKGIKEMADELCVDADDYYDFKGDKIMVTEKHSLDNKRRTYAIPDKETTD